jgi:hypothetical protein
MGKRFEAAAEALRTIPTATRDRIQLGYFLKSRVYLQEDLFGRALVELTMLATGCRHALSQRDLNPGRGNIADEARLLLARRCARGYESATGKLATTSHRGEFAKVLRLVFEAVGLPGKVISNDFLKSVLAGRKFPK